MPVKVMCFTGNNGQFTVRIPFRHLPGIRQRHRVILVPVEDQNRSFITIRSVFRTNGLRCADIVAVQLQTIDRGD